MPILYSICKSNLTFQNINFLPDNNTDCNNSLNDLVLFLISTIKALPNFVVKLTIANVIQNALSKIICKPVVSVSHDIKSKP